MSPVGESELTLILAELRRLGAAVRRLEERALARERDETLLKNLQALDANLVAGVDALTKSFGRLDADLVTGLKRQATSTQAAASDTQQQTAQLAELAVAIQSWRDGVLQTVQAADANLVAGLERLCQGFARLDADLVTGLERQQTAQGALETQAASTAQAQAKQHAALVKSMHEWRDALLTSVQGLDARLLTGLEGLGQGFTRLDADLVTGLERIAATMSRLDGNLVAGVENELKTLWEVKAALSAELGNIPQLLAGATASAGPNIGPSEDDIDLAQMFAGRARPEETLTISVGETVRSFGADIAKFARKATEDVIAALPSADLSPLARNSPELRETDFAHYIEMSVIRVAKALHALRLFAPPDARILDFGSYFGNFALAAARAGYTVEAVDAYSGPLGGGMAPFVELMRKHGVTVRDVAETGYDFAGIEPKQYDAVLFMSAIEHVPHTPRGALEAVNRVLKNEGVLVLDTPNLGYVYNRRKFASGHSVFPSIEFQFETEVPFFGHHREYQSREVRWMLERVGHEVLIEDSYNYSIFGMPELSGEHLAMWRLMQAHPQLRELIFTVSRKRTAKRR